MIYLCVQKKYIAVVYLCFANMVWAIFVINLCAYLEKPYLFMIDGYFGLMALMMFAPVLYIKSKKAWFSKARLGLMAILIVFGIHRITTVSTFFEDMVSAL